MKELIHIALAPLRPRLKHNESLNRTNEIRRDMEMLLRQSIQMTARGARFEICVHIFFHFRQRRQPVTQSCRQGQEDRERTVPLEETNASWLAKHNTRRIPLKLKTTTQMRRWLFLGRGKQLERGLLLNPRGDVAKQIRSALYPAWQQVNVALNLCIYVLMTMGIDLVLSSLLESLPTAAFLSADHNSGMWTAIDPLTTPGQFQFFFPP